MVLKWLKTPASSKSCWFNRRKACRCLICGIWVWPYVCQEACENEVLMTHKPAVPYGISAYLSFEHGYYRGCGKPCKATK